MTVLRQVIEKIIHVVDTLLQERFVESQSSWLGLVHQGQLEFPG